MATGRAPHPRESMAQDSTGQVTAEVAFDEARVALAVEPAGLGEEGLEVLADDDVQDALLGLAAAVAVRQGRGRRVRVALVGDGGQGGIEGPRGGPCCRSHRG